MIYTGRRQKGITFIGFLIVGALVAAVAIIAIKLFPLYSEKFKVISAMKTVAAQPDIAQKGKTEIETALSKNFQISYIDRFDTTDLRKSLRLERDSKGGGRLMTIAYEARTPLLFDLDVVMKFDQSMPIAGDALY